MTGWATVWPSSTREVGNNHKTNTQVTQPKPCLAPSRRVQSLGPTGPSQELSGSHKPPWILPSCQGHAGNLRQPIGCELLLRSETLPRHGAASREQITALAFWDIDADILMAIKYSCSILLNETRC